MGAKMKKSFRSGRRVGKYKLIRKLGDGGFGVVYKAYDEVEGQHVALKIQTGGSGAVDILDYFKHEIKLLSKIEHNNILRMKNADIIDGRLFIVSELGICNLAEREKRSVRFDFAVDVLTQMLDALIEVQKNRIVHRDIKPENIIIFPNRVFKLADFGIAKVLERAGRVTASEAGTQGYFAPEQVFGKPSFASDIFSLGLVFYEMITGELPRWPFHWPLAGRDKFNRRVPRGIRVIIRKSLEFNEKERYPNARAMRNDLTENLERARNNASAHGRRRMMPWRKYREKEFYERLGRVLSLNFKCCRCSGPISEYMMYCPWCGTEKNSFKGLTSFPSLCRKCEHGMMNEWDYCPWCYAKKLLWADVWVKPDKRYVKNCPNKYCGERRVMRWMHYCPWCHTKLKPWRHAPLKGKCGKCTWSVADDYWDHCAWCGSSL